MKTLVLLLSVAALLAVGPAYAASCKLSEYANMAVDEGGRVVQVGQEPALAVQNVTYTTTTQSTAFNIRTRFIRVVCDAKAHFEVSTNPTATAADPFLGANSPEYFAVPVGASFEIAFYDGTSI